MASFLRPGLTPGQATRICMEQCRAMCCRGPLILELAPREVLPFQRAAGELAVTAQLQVRQDGSGWLRFADHHGERCPLLDPASNACRIYEQRPQRCREFPERPTPGCAISGG